MNERFSRFSLIGWWEQERLRKARILVVGAGALGNEIIKNLSMLGIGQLVIIDMDRIECSNLSRSVLYRESDEGKEKALVAAARAKDIYPDIQAVGLRANIIHGVGLGIFRWADITLGGLDNREARVWLNKYSRMFGHPFVDGAIEGIQGIAKVFTPESSCYECTLNEEDFKIISQRRSCNLLSRQEMEEGKTPTTPTISSIIAGLQCQETVRLLHGIDDMKGKGYVINGLISDAYTVTYLRRDDCEAHETFKTVICLDGCSDKLTVKEVREFLEAKLGVRPCLEFFRDILRSFHCPECGREEEIFIPLASVTTGQAWCPFCNDSRREVRSFYQLPPNDNEFDDFTFQKLGLPVWDIIMARCGDQVYAVEFSGDAAMLLGEMVLGEEAIEWQ